MPGSIYLRLFKRVQAKLLGVAQDAAGMSQPGECPSVSLVLLHIPMVPGGVSVTTPWAPWQRL
jgi:hypothetical protein